MNVTQTKTDELNLKLTLEIAAEDYAAEYKKRFQDCKRKADFKGFRKGMVPASLIERVYGGQILAESVNEMIYKGLTDYITEQKLNVLGEPLSAEDQPEVEWKNGNDFTFLFDVALSPKVDFEVAKSDEVPHYTVTPITKSDKAPMIENLKKFYEEKNEEKSEEDIDKEVTERLKENYRQEAEWRLTKDIRDYFVKKARLQLPEAFLKRWLLQANEGKVTAEEVEKEFPAFAEDYKWQMVRGYLMEKFGFKVEQNDLTDAAESYVRYQYAMYGLPEVPAEILTDAVNNMLGDRKQVEHLYEQVEDRKVIEKLKEEITIKATKITTAKFREL